MSVARIVVFATLAALLLPLAGCMQAKDPAVGLSSLHIDYQGQKPALDASLLVDPATHPAAALRSANAAPQPAFYTAMDQLQQWSTSSHVPIQVSHASFGFFLNRIDGLPADSSKAYWSLSVNGTESMVGMEAVHVVPGSSISWTLTALS